MIAIKSLKTIARLLDLDKHNLTTLADSADRYTERLLLLDPARPEKPRIVLNVVGPLRRAQHCLLHRLFLRRLTPSPCNHGGVQGRSIRTNALSHAGKHFLYTTDVSTFYPSIHYSRVYRLFSVTNGCSPDVARVLTALCTSRNHLALGLITSPFLADQIFTPIDARLQGLALGLGLSYTRFVDDLTFSGDFDFSSSGVPGVVQRVLTESGFSIQSRKGVLARIDSPEATVTKLRIKEGKLDVRRDYISGLVRQIRDAKSLGEDGPFEGPYATRGQLEGRVRFVCWINPSRRRHLMRLMNAVRWQRCDQNAEARGLSAISKRLVKL